MELINLKFQDYKISDYYEKLEKMKLLLPGIVNGKEFKDQMSRFLPLDVQQNTIERKKYRIMLINELNMLFQKL